MKKKFNFKNPVFLSAICASLMLFAIFLIFKISPFGDATFITGDLNGIYINFYSQMRSAFLEGEHLFYSFQKGLGGSTVGSLAYYCMSPFVLLYMLIAPEYYGTLTTFVVFAKVVLIVCSMAFFLKHKLKSESILIVVVSLCYGFCTWVFAYIQNIMWHDGLILLPLICHGVDILIEKRKPFFYCVSLALCILFNFYIAFMVCIFTVAYFFFSVAILEKQTLKIGVSHCIRFAMSSIIGGLLPAFLYIPAMVEIVKSKGVGQNGFALSFSTEFSIVEFLARTLPFNFYWENIIYDLPNAYVGLLPLLFLPFFLLAKKISMREKIAGFAVLVFLFLTMWSTDLMLLFHGGAMPVWFSFRNAFLFVFWVCFLSVRALTAQKVSKIAWCGITIFIFAVLTCRFIFKEPHYTNTRFLVTAMIIAVLVFCMAVSQNFQKLEEHFAFIKKFNVGKLSMIAVLIITMCELTINVYYTQRQFEKYPNSVYVNFVQQNKELLQKISEQEKTEAYRVEKNYFRSLNDDLLLDYYGISYFSSTQDNLPVMYLQNLDAFREISGVSDLGKSDVFASSVLSIKYLLIKGADSHPFGYVKTDISNDQATVYKNPFALPFAFCVGEDVLNFDFSTQNPETFKKAVYSALSGENSSDLYSENGEINLKALEQLSQKLLQKEAQVEISQTELTAKITTDTSDLLFINVPYSEFLKVTVNGKEVEADIAFASQLVVEISAGENVVNIQYEAPLFWLGTLLSSFSALWLIAWCVISKKQPKLV